MTNSANKIKGVVSRVFNELGYSVKKLPPSPGKSDDVVEILVAGKKIKIHAGNPLRQVYQENPRCNLQIGQLAGLVKQKYPAAWAADVGANIGDTLAVIRSAAQLPIICVEGDEHCYELLQQNAQQFDAVHLFNVFLSSRPQSAFIGTEKEGWNTTLTEGRSGENGRKIEFETLDRLTAKLQCQANLKLLKVDTEGFDLRILRGAEAVLAAARPAISFELNKENVAPLGDSVPDFLSFLTQLGYSFLFLFDPIGKPVCNLRTTDRVPFLSLYANSGPDGVFWYLDILAFHRDDEDLYEKFLALYSLPKTHDE